MQMKRWGFLVGLACGAAAASAAQARIEAADTSALALDRVLSPAVQPLYVNSPAAQSGQPFPDLYTAAGKNISPPVAWDGAPPLTKAYVVIMEDSDAPGGPALHWIAYNIPATAKGLPKGIRNRGDPKSPLGMLQGMNYAGGLGYIGPNPPPGAPPHHYHIEVFALDRPLRVRAGLRLDKLLEMMNERVLAEGEVVGTYATPAPAPAR